MHANTPKIHHHNAGDDMHLSTGKPGRALSYIRTQLVIFHTRLDLICGCLQELPSFQSNPNANHGEVALAGTFEERAAAALGAELTEYWEGTTGLIIRFSMVLDVMR